MDGEVAAARYAMLRAEARMRLLTPSPAALNG
jgi:hypothetical protein